MAHNFIDLTLSPEPEESPSKVARNALSSLQPRKQRIDHNCDAAVPKAKEQERTGTPIGDRRPQTVTGTRRPSDGKDTHRAEGVALANAPAPERHARGQQLPSAVADKSRWNAHNAIALNTRSQGIQRFQDEEAFDRATVSGALFPPDGRLTACGAADGFRHDDPTTSSGPRRSDLKGVPQARVLAAAGVPVTQDSSRATHDSWIFGQAPRPRASSNYDTQPFEAPNKRRRIDSNEYGAHRPLVATVDAQSQFLQNTQVDRHRQLPNHDHGSTSTSTQIKAMASSGADNIKPRERYPQQNGQSRRDLAPKPSPPSGTRGARFTAEENNLLIKLKKVDQLPWKDIALHFNGRSLGSLQVHFSCNLKNRPVDGTVDDSSHVNKPRPVDDISNVRKPLPRKLRQSHVPADGSTWPPIVPEDLVAIPRRKTQRRTGVSVVDSFVPWTQVSTSLFEDSEPTNVPEESKPVEPTTGPLSRQDRTFPHRVSRILRHRELGGICGRAWASSSRGISNELKNHAFSAFRARRIFSNTCGDVNCLAWAPNGKHFAAGSIAISDDRSMQYNSNLNLLLGDTEAGAVRELPEHHVPRPVIEPSTGNVNGLHAMRESQDPRLFMTVAAIGFSPDGRSLYSAGSDRKVRMYHVSQKVEESTCRWAIEQPASVDLLSVSTGSGLVATACHQSSNGSVQVFDCDDWSFEQKLSLSPSLVGSHAALPLYPSALKFGTAARHSQFLLAGFSGDTIEGEIDTIGETALWNVETGQRLHMNTVTRYVFDVAWNPSPSSGSTAFAVASTPGHNKASATTRSVVQVYAPGQVGARQVISWECPAFDINDVLYCPHDENLIAVGATDGKVYIWDQRFAERSRKPLHILEHGASLNVLDHDRHREQADTGLRFLLWSATGSRLYSGSSDGVVKVWNPYRATQSAHVQDAATFQTAIMSGAFSPDCRELLVGEECGRINHLSIGYTDEDGEDQKRTVQKFKLFDAPRAVESKVSGIEASHELLSTRQVELKPMGDLPIRQAVQGPKYAGPYLMPTVEEWRKAKEDYERALDTQNDTHAHGLIPSSQSSQLQTAVRDADSTVQNAQFAPEQLQKRHDASLEQELAAIKTQLAFHRKKRARLELERSLSRPSEQCTLDCNHLPKDIEGSADAVDSHASEQRIPSAFRALPRGAVDVSGLDCKALYALGLAAKCMFCSQDVSSPAMRTHLQMRCRQRCASIKANLRGRCEQCSAATRGNDEEIPTKLCQRCDPACFRCARSLRSSYADVSGADVFYCDTCRLGWEAGILGYELMDNP